MSKSVQIPLELFYDLIRVHLIGENDTDTLKRISDDLESKLDAIVKHDLYTTSKTANTPQEREQARQEYLDKVGIKKDFRW